MNDAQFYISVAVGPAVTMVVVLIGVLFNNNRISDLNNCMTDLNNRIGDLHGRISDLRSDMKEMFRQHGEVQEANLRRVEDMLLGKFAELDNRLSRIEARGH